MDTLRIISTYVLENIWLLSGGILTAGYGVVLVLMVRKVMQDRSLPEHQKPGPKPMFYLGQAYLAFIWPIPLFLVLEALDLLDGAP